MSTGIVNQVRQLIEIHGSFAKAKKSIVKLCLDNGVEMLSTQEWYDTLNNIEASQRIAPCGKEKRFDGFWGGYRFCGGLSTCACAVENTKVKSENTNLSRYGVRRPLQNSSCVERLKTTNMDRYGVDNVFRAAEVRDRIQTTIKARYGVDNVSKNPEVQEKRKKTNLDRYGVECNLQTDAGRNATKKTMNDLYGVDHPSYSTEIQARTQLTNHNRYGAPFTFQVKEFQDKARNTLTERYGRPNYNQSRVSDESLQILDSSELLQNLVERLSTIGAATELGVSVSTVNNYWNKHNLPARGRSSYETAMIAMLEGMGVEYMVNTRTIIKPLELDFYIPQFSLGIELNGLYWHSSNFKDAKYHRTKYELCRDNNIKLIMINEDEWILRREAVLSYIRHSLFASERGPGARTLDIRDIDRTSANRFLETHHIQGKTANITYSCGAFINDTLVGIMCFGKQRGTGEDELTRFCSDAKSYPGLFSRMFKYSVRNNFFNSVISFADLRYSSGDVYVKNGFDCEGEIPPDYRYVKGLDTFHKSQFTKKRIAKMTGMDMSNTTEALAMEELGFSRIYDCGKLKFRWTAT